MIQKKLENSSIQLYQDLQLLNLLKENRRHRPQFLVFLQFRCQAMLIHFHHHQLHQLHSKLNFKLRIEKTKEAKIG